MINISRSFLLHSIILENPNFSIKWSHGGLTNHILDCTKIPRILSSQNALLKPHLNNNSRSKHFFWKTLFNNKKLHETYKSCWKFPLQLRTIPGVWFIQLPESRICWIHSSSVLTGFLSTSDLNPKKKIRRPGWPWLCTYATDPVFSISGTFSNRWINWNYEKWRKCYQSISDVGRNKVLF